MGDIISLVIPHFLKVFDNFFLLLLIVPTGRYSGCDHLLLHLVVQLTQPGMDGVHLGKRVPEFVDGHLTGGDPLPDLLWIIQLSEVDLASSFV